MRNTIVISRCALCLIYNTAYVNIVDVEFETVYFVREQMGNIFFQELGILNI